MESLFVRVLTLSLTGSAVLLPLLLLAPRLRGRYAAGTLSVLWLVLALRMALPVPLSLPWTAVTVDVSALSSVTLPAAPRAPAEVPEPAGPESVEPPRAVPPAAAPEGRPLPLLELAAWVWLAGWPWRAIRGRPISWRAAVCSGARSRARRRRGPNWRPWRRSWDSAVRPAC